MDGILVAYTLVAMMYIYVLLYSPSVSYYGRRRGRSAPRRGRRSAAVAAPAAVAAAPAAVAAAPEPEPEAAPAVVEEYSYEYPLLF